MHTENAGGGGKLGVSKCKGGQNVYNVLTFKSLGRQELT